MAGADFIEVDRWLGRTSESLDPASMRYRSKLAAEDAGDCAGCCFRGQASKVCKEASALAVRAGLNDCDDRDTETKRTFVYVLVPIDDRQLIVEGAERPAPRNLE